MPSIFGLHRSQVLRRLVQGVIGLQLTGLPALAQDQLWIQQFGTVATDTLGGVAEDGLGGAYALGSTAGNLAAQALGSDAWLARFDAAGTPLWTVQIRSRGEESGSVCAGNGSGGVLVAGTKYGPWSGPQASKDDVWFARYDGNGDRTWAAELGGPENDWIWGICADGTGGAFACGQTQSALGGPFGGGFDGWVARLDSGGGLTWVVQIPEHGDGWAKGIASDGAGGALVCGVTSGTIEEINSWLSRYDGAGALSWTRRIGPIALAEPVCMTADGTGGVFVGGFTSAPPGGGFFDAWIGRYDRTGTQVWLQQFGGGSDEILMGLSGDGAGGVFGCGSVGDITPYSFSEVFAVRFDGNGERIWSLTLGNPHKDNDGNGVCPDGRGGLFLAGDTADSLAGPYLGMGDIWLARYDGSCNSGTTYCVASTTSLPGCQASISATGSPTLSNPTAWTVSSGPIPGANIGLLLFGASGKDNTPYGTLGGQLCVAAPTFRTAPKSSGGDQGQCNGSYAFTLDDLIASSSLVTSGATINAQVWARDPGNADGFLLSDGIEVAVCP